MQNWDVIVIGGGGARLIAAMCHAPIKDTTL